MAHEVNEEPLQWALELGGDLEVATGEQHDEVDEDSSDLSVVVGAQGEVRHGDEHAVCV